MQGVGGAEIKIKLFFSFVLHCFSESKKTVWVTYKWRRELWTYF